MLFKFQLDASYLVNEYLQDNKICILSGANGIGKKYIVKHMESNFDIYPIIENIYTIKELFSQLLVFNNELNRIDLEIGVGQAIQVNIPITQMFNKFCSFLKSDFDNLEKKILDELNSLTKKNNLLLTIQLYINTSNSLIDFIFNELTKLDLKILLIVDSEDNNFLNIKGNLQSVPNISIECTIQDLYCEFEGLLSKNEIDKIVALSSGNIKYIIEIYKYLSSHPSADIIDYTQLKITNIKEENSDAYNLLEFLSYFKDNFSVNEIKYIYNKLYDDFKVYSQVNQVLKYIIENNILKEDHSFYCFVLSIFKQILRQNIIDEKIFYKTLGECVKELYPLDLDGQFYFYSKAEDEYVNIIKLFMIIRLARNKNYGDEIFQFIETIEDENIHHAANIFVKAYEKYYQSQFDEAIEILLEINSSDDSKITNEANYLIAICYWKKSTEFKSESHKILETIVTDSNTFEETVLLSKMVLLSIYSNDAQYHDINNFELYNNLKKYIREKIKNDKDYELLLNILKRKSNCVFTPKQSVNDLKNSFDYFCNHKYAFNEEFAMSLCNYSAVLLNLGKFDESIECYTKIKWDNLYDSYKLYNYNNYILAQFFLNKNIITENIMKDIYEFETLVETCSTSVDTKILTYVNLAGLKVYEGEFEKAKQIYELADNLNNNYDDYFTYFINSNMCVIAILNNDYNYAKTLFNNSNYVPKLFSAYEKQYLRKRNEVLLQIIENNEANLTLEAISGILSERLNSAFVTNNIDFFSTAILFSDIQFWTDN